MVESAEVRNWGDFVEVPDQPASERIPVRGEISLKRNLIGRVGFQNPVQVGPGYPAGSSR